MFGSPGILSTTWRQRCVQRRTSSLRARPRCSSDVLRSRKLRLNSVLMKPKFRSLLVQSSVLEYGVRFRLFFNGPVLTGSVYYTIELSSAVTVASSCRAAAFLAVIRSGENISRIEYPQNCPRFSDNWENAQADWRMLMPRVKRICRATHFIV